jgi:hypothetical protein
MQRATDSLANPFLTPEFSIAVGAFRPTARVAVLYDGPSIVGFFPFERGRLGAGTPICGWPGALCQGLVHIPDLEWDARDLLKQCKLSIWQFDHLVQGQKGFEPYQTATASSPVMDLKNGFSEYYSLITKRSARLRRDLVRRQRSLADDAGELQFISDSRETDLMRTLMKWKSAQYHRIGVIDRFDRPWIVALLDALHAIHTQDFKGLLSAMYVGGRPVAVQFGLCARSSYAGWFTTYDPDYGKYSPGLIQLINIAEHYADMGIETIDLGKGPASYKERFKSYNLQVAEGIVTARSALGAAHYVRSASVVWAGQTLYRHPKLYRATGVIRRTVRRTLSVRLLRLGQGLLPGHRHGEPVTIGTTPVLQRARANVRWVGRLAVTRLA